MIRRRLTSANQSERASPEPRRRRISRTLSPSMPSDDCDLSDDDLRVKLRDSFLAAGARVREAIRREIGDDLLPILHESLGNMSSRERRQVLSLLDHLIVTSVLCHTFSSGWRSRQPGPCTDRKSRQ